MVFELGLKLTHRRDDVMTSMADLQITKDPSGPLFVSKETDSKFILTGHLKGLRKENIDIEINEAGNRIAICGKKPVQEMVLIGWIMQKKEVEIRSFGKVFRIPDGVILDKIKAKFNEEISNLTIIMPKLVREHCGVVIEEVKEDEVDRGRPEAITQNVVDKIAKQPEMKPVTACEDPEKDTNKEVPKEEIIEEKIEGKQESSQVVEQAIDTGIFEARDAVGEETTEKEKPEEAEEKIDGGESRSLENAAEAETVRVKSKEESSKSEEEAQVLKKTEPLQAEDTLREKIPGEKAPEMGIEKHVPGPEMAKPEESGDDQGSLPTRAPGKQTTIKDHQVETEKPEELQKQEHSTEVEELTKSEEPCQVPEPEETQGNEIDQFQEKSDHEDPAPQTKKHVCKRNKVCPPLVVAGSSLLVSLIVLVFQMIRAKKT